MSHFVRAARRLVLVVSVSLAVIPASAHATAELAIVPEEVDFGSQLVGASADRTVTIRNLGPDATALSEIFIAGTGLDQFDFVDGTCMLDEPLAPDAECLLTLRFSAPAAPGDFEAFLAAEGEMDDDTPAVARLIGRSVAPTPPGNLVAEPVTVRFPRTRVGSVSPSQEVLVRNSGAGPIALPPAAVANPHFGIVSNDCPSMMAAGGSCRVSVTFKPTDGPPLPMGHLVGGITQRDVLAFGARDPATNRFPVAVILLGDAVPALDLATVEANLGIVLRSVPKVLRGGPNEAFLAAFRAPEAGTLALQVYGQIGKRRVLIGRASDHFRKGERYALPVSVTRRGRKMLRRPKRTRIKVVLSFTTNDKIATTRQSTFKVKPPKLKRPPKSKRKRKRR